MPSDVIISVNSTPVMSPAELGNLIRKAGRNVALLVQRTLGDDRATVFVSVELG